MKMNQVHSEVSVMVFVWRTDGTKIEIRTERQFLSIPQEATAIESATNEAVERAQVACAR